MRRSHLIDLLELLDNNSLVAHYENKIARTNRWRLFALTISLSIAIWVREPKFDFIPAIAALIFKVIGFFAYGIFGTPTDSFIGLAWRYINLGYATIFGPIIILGLTWGWTRREKEVNEIANFVIKQRLASRGLTSPIKTHQKPHHPVVTTILIVSSTIVFLQLFHIKARADSDEIKIEMKEKCGYSTEIWAAPWPETENWTSWLRFDSAHWCVKGIGSNSSNHSFMTLPGFRAASDNGYFNQPPAILGWIQNLKNTLQSSKLASIEQLSALTSTLNALDEAILNNLLKDNDPFKRFPYIYPPLNLIFSFSCWLATIILCIRSIVGTQQLCIAYRFMRRRVRKQYFKIRGPD